MKRDNIKTSVSGKGPKRYKATLGLALFLSIFSLTALNARSLVLTDTTEAKKPLLKQKFAEPSMAFSALRNVAIGAMARQSSTYGGNQHAANKVCDGNAYTFNHTHAGPNQWIEIDLGREYNIQYINVLNRMDGGLERLQHFEVLVSKYPNSFRRQNKAYHAGYVHSRDKVKNGAPWLVSKSFLPVINQTVGRYVSIISTDNNFLHIAELEVYAAPMQGPSNRVNRLNEAIKRDMEQMAAEHTRRMAQSFFSNVDTTMVAPQKDSIAVTFVNRSQAKLDLFVNDQKYKELNSSSTPQMVKLKIGDQIYTVGTNTRNAVIGTPHLFINSSFSKIPVFLNAVEEVEKFEQRTGRTKDFSVNLQGIDLLDFDPAFVSNSFKPSGQIFRAMAKFSYNDMSTAGNIFVVPAGFGNLGDSNIGFGNFTRETIIGRDKLQESWSVGASGSVSIPVKGKGMTVTPNIGFNYRDQKLKETNQNDVFVSSIERSVVYDLGIRNITEVFLDEKFVFAVENINSLADARRIVSQYGTHYTDNVAYGAIKQKYLRLSEASILNSHTRGFDLNGGVKVSKDASGITKTRSPFAHGGTTTITGSNNSSQLAEVNFSAGWERTDEAYDETSSLTERYSYVGKDDDPVAIGVGNLIPISALVYAPIMKSKLGNAELKLKRQYLEQAINDHLSSLRNKSTPAPYRTFSYRVSDVKWEIADPPLGNTIDGSIQAVTNLGTLHHEVAKLENDQQRIKQFVHQELLKDKSYLNRDDCVDKTKWHVVKQYGYYSGFGSKAKAVFDPVQLNLVSSHLLEHDPIGGHDLYKVVPSTYTINNESKRQSHVFELKHPFDGTEGGTMRITIEIQPGVGFGDNAVYIPNMN
ncbi:MAG: discoidin domain-containing protein [Flavobacteriaceae bacterium]